MLLLPLPCLLPHPHARPRPRALPLPPLLLLPLLLLLVLLLVLLLLHLIVLLTCTVTCISTCTHTETSTYTSPSTPTCTTCSDPHSCACTVFPLTSRFQPPFVTFKLYVWLFYPYACLHVANARQEFQLCICVCIYLFIYVYTYTQLCVKKCTCKSILHRITCVRVHTYIYMYVSLDAPAQHSETHAKQDCRVFATTLGSERSTCFADKAGRDDEETGTDTGYYGYG